MERSLSSSCKWTPDIPRPDFGRHTHVGHADTQAKPQDQFYWDNVNGFAANSILQTPSNNPANLSSRYECPAEDLELLNIPSIHETLSSSLDFPDISTKQNSSTTDWEYLEVYSKSAGHSLNLSTDTCPHTCKRLESNCADAPEHSPREPLKQLRRQRANDRERRRMKSLNGALNNLKRCIPLPKTKRRITKLEILRIACHYIQTLWETLNSGNEEQAERAIGRTANRRSHIVNGMTVTQRLSLLSNNLKFNSQL